MTVEHVRTTPVVRPGLRTTARPAPALRPPPARPVPSDRSSICFVLPEIADGEAMGLVRNLRRRESTRAVLLSRTVGRRELVVLLGGGIRGAVAAEPTPAVRAAGYETRAPRRGPELTARELGVLQLVAEGRSNRQIGELLELSALTVKSHLARISRKVGTGDRAEMVAFA
ncbi:MAG TPA: helix-turn-helix transcriptional regulator, partial [Actinotalea sp.]|nr:helix-turn-helix transcriptional regulator [Actinotalea sp.]